jgi:hypothetical protein
MLHKLKTTLNMKKYFFTTTTAMLLLLTLLTLADCRKDPPPTYTGPQPIDYTVLPPATQTGAGTFGCLVDGEVWVPRVPLLAVTYVDKYALVSEKNGTGGGGISCNLVDIEKEQDNWLSVSFGNTFFSVDKFCHPEAIIDAQFRATSGRYYQSSYFDIDENCITFTRFDTSNNIISGVFNFTVYKDTINKSDKIKITDGRFDLKYFPQ